MLKEVYNRLYNAYGPQHWWPGETPFEIIVGTILTQNTSWENVEKAISNLKTEGLLTPRRMKDTGSGRLASLIRPSGYFNIKAMRLNNFIAFLSSDFKGDIDRMFSLDLKKLRHKLLEVNGIGPETADSILLYAGNYPIFVVDTYTKRIFSRLRLFPDEHTYHQVQLFFMENLKENAGLFNEYHALIVNHAKEHCRKKPLCGGCPLLDVPCPLGQSAINT